MKAVWKGYLQCSLVTIPIKMYHAVSRNVPQFHLYHEKCGSQIRQENTCPVCRQPLAPEEIVRGYQYGKDLHVVISDADLQQARKESTDIIEIVKFVDESQIHPLYFTDSHYLVPDGPAGAEALAIFRQAMGETGKTAVARAVMRHREYLYNIRPYDRVLIAFTLHYPEEIRGVQEIEEAAGLGDIQVKPDHLEMARTIIAHLSGDFVPGDYRDEYTQTLREIIRAKAEGKEIKAEPKVEREKVINLMEALKKSVEATGAPPPVPRKDMARAGRLTPKARKERQQA